MWAQQRQVQKQIQRVDPKVILSSTILQLNTIELQNTVAQEILDNPALEMLDDEPYVEAQSNPFDEQKRETFIINIDDREIISRTTFNPDDEQDWTNFIAAPISLHEEIHSQLIPMTPNHLLPIAEFIIETIDDQGYLTLPSEEIANMLNVDLADVNTVITILHECEPVGVGAISLRECLYIQACKSDNPYANLAVKIIIDCFDDFTKRNYTKLSRKFHTTESNIMHAVKCIQSLNPHPGETYLNQWSVKSPAQSSIKPDVVITRSVNGYNIEIHGFDPNALSINANYRRCYIQTKNNANVKLNSNDKEHILQYTERAVNFINSIKQRRRTLKSIAKYLIENQQGFLSTGSYSFLAPITRQDAAKAIGIHESTVSRATMGKYIQLPNDELVSFEVFFKPNLRIRKMVEEIMSLEDPNKPFSDETISQMMKERGVEIARRTINKYRGLAKTPSSRQR